MLSDLLNLLLQLDFVTPCASYPSTGMLCNSVLITKILFADLTLSDPLSPRSLVDLVVMRAVN